MSSNAAASAVFGTVELLENILLHLPPDDVLRNKRTNSSWKAASTDSPQLRRHIFLEQQPMKQKLIWKLEKSADGRPNWIGNLWDGVTVANPKHQVVPIVSIHPVFKRLTKQHDDALNLSSYSRYQERSEAVIWLNLSHLLLWNEGQWRDMFVANQPCKRVRLSWNAGYIEAEEGVTLGMLRETYEAAFRRSYGNSLADAAQEGNWINTMEVKGCLPDDSVWLQGIETTDQSGYMASTKGIVTGKS